MSPLVCLILAFLITATAEDLCQGNATEPKLRKKRQASSTENEAKCIAWLTTGDNVLPSPIKEVYMKTVLPCPCDKKQATLDDRFRPHQSQHIASEHCFIERSPHSDIVKFCCYDPVTTTMDPNAGQLFWKKPDLGQPHIDADLSPYQWCCEDSNHCSEYRAKRPVGTCDTYIPLATTWVTYYPHWRSLDRYEFTFNGLGEYTLVGQLERPSFLLHVKMGRAKDCGGKDVQATAVIGLAAKLVVTETLRIIATDTALGFAISVGEKDLTGWFAGAQDGDATNEIGVQISKGADDYVVVSFIDGVILGVGTHQKKLRMLLGVPASLKNNTQGLLGPYNDDPSDDLTPPGGATPLNTTTATDSQIFSDFGEKWRVACNDSLFPLPCDTVAQEDFRPVFTEDALNGINGAGDTCQTSDEYLYVLAVTGNKVLADSRCELEAEIEKEANNLANLRPLIEVDSPINATLGVETKLFIKVVDTDSVTLVLRDNEIAASLVNLSEYTYELTWTPKNESEVKIRLLATDSKGGKNEKIIFVNLVENGPVLVVNGGLGPWTVNGSCSVTCGGGGQLMIRPCNNPTPSGEGLACTGIRTGFVKCNTQPCPPEVGTPGEWGIWRVVAPCTVSCGYGVQAQKRYCDSPTPKDGGRYCIGTDVRNEPCYMGKCPDDPRYHIVDGGWGKWDTVCSVTCGVGTKPTARRCNNPAPGNGGRACVGESTGEMTCYMPACPTPPTTSTTTSTTTTATTAASSPEVTATLKPIPSTPVPVNGGFGEWQNDGACSVTCGRGLQAKIRHCDNPIPLHGGLNCVGDNTHQEICDMPTCAINGGWSEWVEIVPCSVTCGEGLRTVERVCNNPKPQNGGAACAGQSRTFAMCNLTKCTTVETTTVSTITTTTTPATVTTTPATNPAPINGSFGEWVVNGSCSVSCGEGYQRVHRKCDSPAPQHGGLPCAGSAIGLRSCAIACYATSDVVVNGGWSQWDLKTEPCSVTCGIGDRLVRRTCTKPAPQNGGKNCEGANTGHIRCEMNDCSVLVNGGWSEWVEIAPCSVTCGEGIRNAERACNNPKPQNGGAPCAGPSRTFAMCNLTKCTTVETITVSTITTTTPATVTTTPATNPAPINGSFGEWVVNGSCSVSCGEGYQRVDRKCDSPAPQHGGLPCVGSVIGLRPCVIACYTASDVVNGGWSKWDLQTEPCSVTCGIGDRLVRRTCTKPAPQNGGINCEGANTGHIRCEMKDCPDNA